MPDSDSPVITIHDSTNPQRTATLAALAALAAAGDDGAFEQVHDRLNSAVVRYFAQRVRPSDNAVTDLAQTVWIEVWKSLRNGVYDENRAALTTFIFAVAHKVLLRHLAKPSAPSGAPLLIHQATPATDDDLAENSHRAELIQAIRDCIFSDNRLLAADERQLMIDLANGATERTLAEQHGVSASTIHARKSAILDRIRRHLAQLGFSRDSPERQQSRLV